MGRPPPYREPVDSGYDQTYDYHGDEPNLPPDAAILDSGYERDPTHAFEDPEEEPEEEIDNEFTRACAQGLRRLFQPRQVPRETTGWAAPLPGHGTHDGEPDWGEDPNQPAWGEGEAQPDPAPPTGRNHRPELWDDEDNEELPSGRDRRPELWDDEDMPHSAQFTDPRLARTLKEAPRGAGAPNDGGVPHCAQFANPRLPTKTRKPPEDEGGVPYCAQFADEDTIAAALRQRKRWGGKSERGEDASTLPPDLAAPSRPDPGPAPPRPPTDSAHFRDPAEDQEEPPSQDTQGPAENDQTTHDLPVLDCDEAELEAMVAELNEDPNADPDAAETPAGGQQRGGVFTVPKLLAILFGMVTTFATTDAHRLAVPNGTSASPARPELHFYRMYDGSHVTCEEDGSATTTWTLILLLGAVVATLLIRTQHLEHLVGDPLRKEPPAPTVPLAVQAPARLEANLTDVTARLHRLKEHAVAPLAEAVSLLLTRVQHVESLVEAPREGESSAPATPTGPPAPAQPGVDLANLAARLQQLEEKAAAPTTVTSQPTAACPLASPTLPFFQATRVRVEAPGSRIDYLDPNDYWAYEMAVQQGEDSICQWFIREILHPTLAGSPVTWEGTGLGPRSLAETDTMLKDRFRFRIYRSRRGQDYDLLVYEDDRIYVPRPV